MPPRFSVAPLVLAWTVLALALTTGPVSAQESEPGDSCPIFRRFSVTRPEWDCFRRESTGLPAASAGSTEPVGFQVAGLAMELSPARLSSSYRSAYPVVRNRGLAWGGRGVSGSLTAGLSFESSWLSVVVEPEIAWSENRSFPVPDGPVGVYPDRSHWSYPWVQGVIDWPMRFGSEAFVSTSLGQSHVEARAWGARAGVSNENLWIGPARRYPLLLGNNAPGFPHLYVETATPLSTPVGELRVGAFWGMLEESDYFFSTSPRNRRILTVLHGSWSVPFLEGLDVGATAMLQENVEAGLDLSYLTTIFAASPHQSSRIDPADGRGNVHARWRFPDPGFEVYGEWGFNDFWGSMDDFLGEPDHAQAFTVGLERKHRSPTDASGWRLIGEMVSLKVSRPRWLGYRVIDPLSTSFYAHDGVRPGHTHRGRLLGAYVGPGSDAQFLAFERWTPGARWSTFLERVRWNDDSYYRHFGEQYGFHAHDIEWTIGGSLGRPVGPVLAGVQAGLSRRKNRHFLGLDGVNWDFVREWNVWVDVDVAWRPEV